MQHFDLLERRQLMSAATTAADEVAAKLAEQARANGARSAATATPRTNASAPASSATTTAATTSTTATGGTVASAATAVPIGNKFTWYDGVKIVNGEPDFKAHGFKDIALMGHWLLFSDAAQQNPNEAGIKHMAKKAALETGSKQLVVNIENWPLDVRHATPAAVQASMAKLTNVFKWMRQAVPGAQIGIYGMMPIRDYWTPLNHATAYAANANPYWLSMRPTVDGKMAEWRAANDFVKPLANKVDVIYPSLYTFYNEPAAWKIYAEYNIAEAKRFGKPVVPFLWPQFHEANAQVGGQYLSPSFWRTQIQTVRENADGALIWLHQQSLSDYGWVNATFSYVDQLAANANVTNTGATPATGTSTGTTGAPATQATAAKAKTAAPTTKKAASVTSLVFASGLKVDAASFVSRFVGTSGKVNFADLAAFAKANA